MSEQSQRARRFAIIIDEAHSSAGGSSANDLRYALTGRSEEEWGELNQEDICRFGNLRDSAPAMPVTLHAPLHPGIPR